MSEPSPRSLTVVIVTGTSGSGKSTAIRALEDLGYFCIDNMPVPFLGKLVELIAREGGGVDRLALVVDVREGSFLQGAPAALMEVRAAGHALSVLFLDSSDETLIRRFSETRRRHPLAPDSAITDGIARERERLADLRRAADHVVDTSKLTVHELRALVAERFAPRTATGGLALTVMSFGFRHGIPAQADLVLDLRFLPNPYFVDALRPFPGTDPRVAEYVLGRPETREFLDRIDALLAYLVPHYRREGKAYLTVALGCTGGRHRSVAIAEELARRLSRHEATVVVRHRDVDKD